MRERREERRQQTKEIYIYTYREIGITHIGFAQ
jgi:hypothetical protein